MKEMSPRPFRPPAAAENPVTMKTRIPRLPVALVGFFREAGQIADTMARRAETAGHDLLMLEFLCLIESGSGRSENLAEACGLAPDAVRQKLEAMRRAGLIEPDREAQWRMTSEGERIIDVAMTKLLPDLFATAKAVSAPDIIDCSPILRKIRVHLES